MVSHSGLASGTSADGDDDDDDDDDTETREEEDIFAAAVRAPFAAAGSGVLFEDATATSV